MGLGLITYSYQTDIFMFWKKKKSKCDINSVYLNNIEKIVSNGVLGVLGQSLKKCGRLRQTNDVLATFHKQRNKGGKGVKNGVRTE